MIENAALVYAQALISRPSVTPDDGGCQDYIAQILQPLGFVRHRVDAGGVTNSCYQRAGESAATLAFAGHTDVVPTGPLNGWPHPPFAAVVERGVLHGRGTQDMKGAIACWMAAVESLVAEGIALPHLQLLITSDEEGESVDGTIRLVEWLEARHALPDAVVVGEPSSLLRVGDTVRCGRRGVVQGKLIFAGKQGHSAYPQDAQNAIHHAAPALARIAAFDWGEPAAGFPATSCQITNLHAGTGAINVIPGSCEAVIDLRYNPANDFDGILAAIRGCCAGVEVDCQLVHVAQAFVTPDGSFRQLIAASIARCSDMVTKADTGGGTSDGRFFAAAGVPVVELGLTNSTIHQVGEQVAVEELAQLTDIYADIVRYFGEQ